jgi:release factor glutamine methyltransferase
MLISEALVLAKNLLKQKGVNSYQIDALLILCHCLSLTKEQIIFNPQSPLNKKQQNKLNILLNRRAQREPMSHIIGCREFFGFDFIVNSNVLDPRPDSETLIEFVLEIFTDLQKPLVILELGVGSGCLLIAILKYFHEAFGLGVDISSEALEVAQKNSDALNLSERIDFAQSNWLSNLKLSSEFDLIISNPPYIKTSDINFLQEEVKNFEPHLALDGGEDGLKCYLDISKDVKKFMKKDAFLLLEIGQNQEDGVIKIFNQSGLQFIRSKKDLSSITRCLLFQNTNYEIT